MKKKRIKKSKVTKSKHHIAITKKGRSSERPFFVMASKGPRN